MKNLKKKNKYTKFEIYLMSFIIGLTVVICIIALFEGRYHRIKDDLPKIESKACYQGCLTYNDALETAINGNPPETDEMLLYCAIQCNK